MATYSEFATQRLHKAVQQKLSNLDHLGIIGHVLTEHATDQAILIIFTAQATIRFEFKYNSDTLAWIQQTIGEVKTEQTPLVNLAQLFKQFKDF